MSFKATLELGNNSHKIKNASFSLHQEVDFSNGKPASIVIPGTINIDMDLTGKNIQELWDWGADSHMKKKGSIKFYKIADGKSTMTELVFEDAFCVGFNASMKVGSASMNADLIIQARKLEINKSPVELSWE